MVFCFQLQGYFSDYISLDKLKYFLKQFQVLGVGFLFQLISGSAAPEIFKRLHLSRKAQILSWLLELFYSSQPDDQFDNQTFFKKIRFLSDPAGIFSFLDLSLVLGTINFLFSSNIISY